MSVPLDRSQNEGSAPWGFALTQAGIGVWLVAWSRGLAGTGPNGSGALDDLSLVALFCTLQVASVAIGSKRRAVRLATGLPLVLVLASFLFWNALFFDFFQTPLSVAALQLVGIAADAGSSLPRMLGPGNVLGLLVVPIGSQWLILRRASQWPSSLRARAPVVVTLVIATIMLAAAAGLTRKPVFLFVEQNPAMSLLRDVIERSSRGAFGSPPLAGRTEDLAFLLNRDGYEGYRGAGTPSAPLLQVPDGPSARRGSRSATPADGARNVVLVLMESMRGLEMQGAFRDVPVTPALNALERNALVFPNFYANGMTTVDGEFSTLCSALPVVNEAPVYIRKPLLDIRCLPEILGEHGYSTHWISAYRSSYANKRKFLRRHGIDHILDDKAMDQSRMRHPKVGWGMGDVDMFAQAVERIGTFREPFFTEIMTLSNHHPFDHDYDLPFPAALAALPGNQHYRDYLRGMHYTDHAVGRFLAAAREMPWFSRTLFVILGDHAVRAYPDAPSGGPLGPVLEAEVYFRNRLLLYGPGWLEPAVRDTLGSQIDVAPTLLDLLDIKTENSFLGVSLLAELPHDRRFALMNIGHVFNMRAGDNYCYSVGYSCFEGTFPRCGKGVKPTSLGHTCFEARTDLLTHPDLPGQRGAENPTRDLDALDRLRVLDRAERIMNLNRRLIEEGLFRAAR